tara:strand:+ start:1247 stop:1744 length:498 start_codon:yes stop_codon:yes gene_type:complete
MAGTYSFDAVSDFDRQELINAIDQVKREIDQRYDLKDSNTSIEVLENELIINTASDMTLKAVEIVLRQKATKRKLSLRIFDFQQPEISGGNRIRQKILLKRGLSQEIAKKLSKSIRDNLKKINVSIQGDSLRIIGKSKDDLQEAMSILSRYSDELNISLQYENYR